MANLTQTPAQVQADLDAVEASNVGLDSVTDGSDTQATALKKSGFFGLAESTTDAPTTDRAVMLTIARDVDAVGEIRHGQIVLTEPGNAYFTVDDGGTLGTWSQIATTAGSQTLTNKALNGTLGATTPASASVTTLNASGATTLSSTLDVTGAATLAGLTATGKILSSSANIDAVGAVTTADSAIGYKLGNLGGNAFIFKNTSAGGGFSGAAANALSIGTTNTARVELAVNNAVGSYQDTAGFNVLGTLGVAGATTLSGQLTGTGNAAGSPAAGAFQIGGESTFGLQLLGQGTSSDVTLYDRSNNVSLQVINGGNVEVSTGNLVIGTSGKGIDFDAAAGGTSQLFDWYEEGTFTPTLTFGGGSTGLTTSTFSGKYTREGDTVTIQIRAVLTNKGVNTGNALVGNLPFTATGTYFSPMGLGAAGLSHTGHAWVGIQVSTATAGFSTLTDAGTFSSLTEANFTNATQFDVSGTYHV